MSSNSQVDLTSIGLKMNYLYEVLATTYSIKNNKIIPNTAAMGIRLLENNTIKIKPFPNTTTFKNLDSTKLIVLNFVDDIFLYAITSLKCNNISNSVEISSEHYYNYFPFDVKNEYKEIFKRFTQSYSIQLPYLKQAWAIITCVVTNKNLILKHDNFGKSELMEINLSVISYKKFKESFKLFNRAENITLETIVLATKLKIATEKKDKTLIRAIKRKIEEKISEIQRFGKNESAIKAIEHIKNYINRLES